MEIFLWEKNVEAAWEEAQAGGCSGELWLKLAKLREKEHPEDAIPVYQKLVEAHADRKTNRDYAEAAALVKRIQELLNGLDRKADFSIYLTQLRLRHKPKRNFMKALERVPKSAMESCGYASKRNSNPGSWRGRRSYRHFGPHRGIRAGVVIWEMGAYSV